MRSPLPPPCAWCMYSITLSADDTSVDVSGTFNISLSGASNTVEIPFDANATILEASGTAAEQTSLD